jgi:hypothetical protein
MGIVTVLWEKWTEFRRDYLKITAAAILAPLLYLLVFGQNIETGSDGRPYLSFLIPGLVSMASMTGSFGAVIQNMSVQRLYEKALDQVMISPTPLWQFLLGQVIGGSLRGLYSGVLIILVTAPLGMQLRFGTEAVCILLLNGMVFATLGLWLSFTAKSYADAPRLTAYVMTPMSFLCNTFFPIERMPVRIRPLIRVLPLSQTSALIRSAAEGEESGAAILFSRGSGILLLYLTVLSIASAHYIYRKKTM